MSADHDDERRSQAVTRRGLLGRGAGLGMASLTAGVSAEAGADATGSSDDPKRLTYRETDHIRAFYRRSRL